MDREPTPDPHKHLLETEVDGAVVLDATTGRILLANNTAARIFGFGSPQEMAGLDPLDYVPGEDQERVALALAQSLEQDRPIPAEIRMTTKDGRAILVSVTSGLIEHEGKKATVATIKEITSEKAKDSALREAEHQYERLFDGMPDGAVVLDVSTFEIVLANNAAAHILGFAAPQEMVGQNLLKYIGEDNWSAVAHMISLSLDGRGNNPIDIRVSTRDKRELWVSATATKVEYDGGTATLVTLRDITADKAKDAALKAAEESKMRLMDTAAEAIAVVQDGKVVHVNPAGAKGVGISQQQMIGLSFLDFVHPDDKQAVSERYERLVAGEWSSETNMVRILNAKGQVLWSEVKGMPYLWQGRPAAMMLIEDISARVQAQELLKESEQRLRAIMENAWDGIALFDENFRVTFESPSLTKITGYTPEEWTGSKPEGFYIHPDDLPSLAAVLESIKRQPNSVVRDFKVRYRHKDGSWRWIEATGHNLLHDPKVKGIVVNFRDITERLKIEEALKNSEERFRTLIEKATDVVIVLDATGKITYQSPSLERVTGYGPNQWVDRSLSELLIHPDDLASLSSLLERILTQPGVTVEGVTARYQHKDGSWHVLEATVTNMLHDPKVNGIVANFRDITERELANKALRASEERTRLLVENANEAVTVIQDGVIKFINPKFSSATGYAAGEVLLKPFLELIHPDDRQMAADYYVRRQKGEEVPTTYQFRFLDKAGNTKWAEINATLFDWEGRPATLGLLSDITERKLAEKALRDSEERFRQITENMLDAVAVVDGNGIIKYVSPSHERILGYRSGDLLGKSVFDFLPPEDVNGVIASLDGILEKGQVSYQYRFRHSDGHYVWGEASAKVLHDDSGNVPGYVIASRDITERKQAEEALKASEAKYRRLFESTQTAMEVISAETGLVILANEATAKMFGFASPDDLIGVDSMVYLRPEDRGWVAEGMAGALADKGWHEIAELQVRTNDGRWLWISGMAVQSEYQGKPALLISLLDITGRKQAEDTLRESEEKYRLLTEKTNDVIWTTDLNLRTTYVSPSVERIVGFTPEERLKQDPTQQMTPESFARAAKALVEHLALEQNPQADPDRTLRIELEYYRKDGSTVWLENQVSGIRDASGTLVGFHGVARDISERRKAEQALKESEERYRLLAQNALDIIWMTDVNLKITYASPSATSLLGYSLEELMAHSFDKLLAASSLAHVTQVYKDAMIREKSTPGSMKDVTLEMEVVPKNGSPIWLEAAVSVARDSEGRFAGFQGACRDITRRKHTEAALTASEAKYKDLFEHTMLGMEVIDGETGKVVLANHAIARMFGFDSPADMVGIDAIKGWVMPEDLDWVLQQFAQAMANPEKHEVATLRVKGKDGRIVWVSGSGTLFDYEGKPAILISLIDVTAVKEAEIKLHESEEKNRLLIENAAEGIIVIQDGVTKFANRKCAEFTGRPLEKLMSTTFVEIVHPADRDMVAENYMRRVAGEVVPNNYQFRIIDAENNTKWLQVNAVRLNWEGKPATMSLLSDITERINAEQALRESEERFRALIEKATDAVAVVDETGKVIYYSPSVENVTGYGLEEWLNRSLSEWNISKEDLASLIPVFEDLLKKPGKAVEGVKVRYMHKDGSWHTLEATVRNMLHDPKIGGIVANFRDITERMKSEQALKESEERYRLLAKNASDIIWLTDANLNITYASPSVTRLLGYSIEEITARPLDKLLTPESMALMTQEYRHHMASEESKPGSWEERTVEIEVLHKDGSRIWLEAAIRDIRDPEGRISGFQGACRDITERKETQEALRESEERFRSLVETTSDWVWETDRNNRYAYVSPKVGDILGYEPDELLGHTPYEFMHQREGRRVSKIVRRFADSRLPFSLLENTCTHKDGHSVVLETSAVPILDTDGSFLGYRGIDRDITERKKVEQELQHSLKRLEKTMESTIEAITTTIETRDPYTTGHQMRVTDLACAIAKAMELSPSQIEGIRVAGLMHDIGKIAIPTEILSKPGKLNEVEYEMIKTHAKIGYNILKKIEFPWPVARTVQQHHERWNGSGYPHGIRGEDVLIEARILAVADVMEAMSSHRPYRPSIGTDKALDEITRNSGILYDPAVVNACVTVFTEGGFKFASSIPEAGGTAGTSRDRPVHSLEDH